ncbi:MAG: hypothetical protein SNG49_06860 [Rikenellaceae bacterium]
MKYKITLVLFSLLGLWGCVSNLSWITDIESTTSENGAIAVDIRIIGTAVDTAGNPVENILVTCNELDYCFTDVEGSYSLEFFEYYDAQFDLTFTDPNKEYDPNGGYITRTVTVPSDITFTYLSGAYQYNNGETELEYEATSEE